MQTMHSIILAAAGARLAAALSLNITAIGAANDASTLECWQMDAPFESSATPGVSGSATALIGTAENITYTVLPAAFDGGLHNAPLNQ